MGLWASPKRLFEKHKCFCSKQTDDNSLKKELFNRYIYHIPVCIETPNLYVFILKCGTNRCLFRIDNSINGLIRAIWIKPHREWGRTSSITFLKKCEKFPFYHPVFHWSLCTSDIAIEERFKVGNSVNWNSRSPGILTVPTCLQWFVCTGLGSGLIVIPHDYMEDEGKPLFFLWRKLY